MIEGPTEGEQKGPTRVQRAFRMHEVPPEKWGRILLRSVVGLVLALAGLGILYGVVRVYVTTQDMSIPLLSVGVALFATGAHMVSGQMLTGSFKAVLSVAGSAKRLLPGGKSEPTEGE